MNWQSFWDQQATKYENPHIQVGRIRQDKTIDEEEIEKIAFYIKTQVGIEPQDRVLDLCCGNGLLSRALAMHCSHLTGIDFSARHLKIAREKFKKENIEYLQGDVSELPIIGDSPFDKIILHFSFQYFDTYELGRKVVQGMKRNLKKEGKIFIGDVPDAAKLRVFYPSALKRLRYRITRVFGRDQMGKFWKESDLQKIAESEGLNLKQIKQPEDFLYQHYRVDYLLETVDG